ncbi:MAG: glycosyltransferase family 2 protein [Butyrivibrio sp.]|nr:glycosyltransferase family 2 protein [Butyrivibrio sp.]
MKTGLVVLNYNDSETVIEFLDKIKEYNTIDSIVVVDNCSTDDSYERIRRAIENAETGTGESVNLSEEKCDKEGAGSPEEKCEEEGAGSLEEKCEEEGAGSPEEKCEEEGNGSPEEKPHETGRKRKERIGLIRADANKGYAAGNNLGVKYLMKNCHPDCIVISNPDVFFSEETLKTMLRHLEKLPDAGLISCRMNCLSSISMPTAWKLPGFRDCLLQDSFIIKKIFGDSTEYPAEYFSEDINKVDVVQGSFFAFRPEAFRVAHGFDEHTFLYYEENILARRLKNAGKQNYLVNTCSYDHYHSVSINKSVTSVKKRLEIAYESRLWYCRRYLHINRLQEKLLGLFHKIGVQNYIIYKKIFR